MEKFIIVNPIYTDLCAPGTGPIAIKFTRSDGSSMCVRTMVGQAAYQGAKLGEYHKLIGEFAGTVEFHLKSLDAFLGDNWTPAIRMFNDNTTWPTYVRMLTDYMADINWPLVAVDLTDTPIDATSYQNVVAFKPFVLHRA